MTIENLRKHQAQLIRALEDAVMVDAHSTVHLTIGKLVLIQQQIEELENEKEWSNENDY